MFTDREKFNGSVEDFGGDECFIWPLFKAAQIHGTGNDDLAGINIGDFGHRDEDAPTRLYLNN